MAKRGGDYWPRAYAALRTRADNWIWRAGRFANRHSITLAIGSTLLAIAATAAALGIWLASGGNQWTYFLDATADVYTNGGAALFGATAIVSSIVMFALQTNFERTPYGLFRKLSADARLLALFGYAFAASAGILIASAFLTNASAPWFNFASTWAVATTLGALFWSYKRALRLVSPIQQINYLLRRVVRDCRMWDRRAERSRPMIEHALRSVPQLEGEFDTIKSAYWQQHPHWSHELERALHNFTALAATYASNGDHQVSGAAINALPELLKAYIHTRRKTFFPENPIFPTGNGTDAFINKVLENLRVQFETSLKRDDQEHCEHCLTAMGNAAQVLSYIDYGSPVATKMHASIATAYLMGSMQRLIADKMPDLAMHAVRQAGAVATKLIQQSRHQEIRGVIDPLGEKAIVPGLATKELVPVTVEAVNKLSHIALMLMGTPHAEVRHSSKRIHELICATATAGLIRTETWIERTHSFPFDFYFSGLTDGFTQRLTLAANAALAKPKDDAETAGFITRFHAWLESAERQYHTLFEACAARESSLGFDLVTWCERIATIAAALATADACPDRLKAQLEDDARKILLGLTGCQLDDAAVRNTSMFRLSTQIAEFGIKATRRGLKELAEKAFDALLAWTARLEKAGAHYPDDLERNIPRLIALAVAINDNFCDGKLQVGVQKLLAPILDSQRLTRLETALRNASRDPEDAFNLSEGELRAVDPEKSATLLLAVADLIAARLTPSPSTGV